MTAMGTPVNQSYPPARTGVYYAECDLGMVRNSRTNAAMDANHDGMESVWNNSSKTRRGRIQLGPAGYWLRNSVGSRPMDSCSLFGTGGIFDYASENHFAAGPSGGFGSRLVAGAADMPSLLDITPYGWRIQDVAFYGNWTQAPAANNAYALANEDEPTTLLLIRSNPAYVLPVPDPNTEYGTGKCIFDGLQFARGKNGVTFGGSSPLETGDRATEHNCDNCHFTRTEGYMLSEALFKFNTAQSVVFTFNQTHSYYCSEVFNFVRGGHADLGYIECIEGPATGARAGLGTRVLHIGDTRENENHYKMRVRIDNKAKRTGVKMVLMDEPGWGTHIEADVAFPSDWWNGTPTDVFDIKGATSLILGGGPYYEDQIKCVDAESGAHRPHVTFKPGTTFPPGVTPDEVINTSTSSGNWSVKWYGCCDWFGVPIADGEATN